MPTCSSGDLGASAVFDKSRSMDQAHQYGRPAVCYVYLSSLLATCAFRWAEYGYAWRVGSVCVG